MPKLKTNRSLAKRVKMSKKGRMKRWHAGKRHILTKKARKRKRHLRSTDTISKHERLNISRLLPYGSQ